MGFRELDSMTPSSLDTLFTHWRAAQQAGTFVRAVLSGPRAADHPVSRLLVRLVQIRGELCWAVTTRFERRDEVKNHPLEAGLIWLRDALSTTYRNALLCTATNDWQWIGGTGQGGQLIKHRASEAVVPSREHDHAKHSLLDVRARDWLQALDILDTEGRVKASRADKHRQIHRYLEVLNPLLTALLPESDPATPVRVADMGCGKGYLTFAVWHWFQRISDRPVHVLGIEAREDLVAQCNSIAQAMGAQGLEFRCGTIQESTLPNLDVLIALHACNRATDEAILRGVAANVRLVVVAPCCHQELRPMVKDPEVLAPLLAHGILKERLSEWLTDGLRALYLEAAGYRTQVFEFIEAGHTPKNLMISAGRSRHLDEARRSAAREQIRSLKHFFGLNQHPLDSLLQ